MNFSMTSAIKVLLLWSALPFLFDIPTIQAQDNRTKIDLRHMQWDTLTDPDRQALNRIELGRYYGRGVSMDSALFYLRQAPEYLDTTEVSLISGLYYLETGRVHNVLGDGELALHYLEQGEALGLPDSLYEVRIDIRSSKAGVLRRLARYEECTELLLEVIDEASEQQDTGIVAISYADLGSIMTVTKRPEEAIKYYERAIELRKLQGELRNRARDIMSLATVYARQSQFDQSIPLFKEAYELNVTAKDRFGRAMTASNLALNYRDVQQYDQAERYFDEAMEIYKQLNNPYRIASTSSMMSQMYFDREQYRKVISTLEPLYDDPIIQENLRLAGRYAKNLSRAHAAIGNYKKAHAYVSDQLTIQDSILTDKISESVSSAQVKYETSLKEAEIDRLALEDEINQTRLHTQRLALGGAGIGILGLTFLLFRLNRQKSTIQSQNNLISTSLQEKEFLLKEIHHRVKNNLQVISSLLKLQSRSTEDLAAQQALDEGRSRVRSMALIHQNLYQEEHLAGIYIGKYLQELVDELIATYKIDTKKVAISIDTPEIILDVETLVPIGLITTELVSNSFKYAFTDERAGQLAISITESDQQLHLRIADNGPGYDVAAVSERSFGLRMVRAFADRLQAKYSLSGDEGSQSDFWIQDFKKVVPTQAPDRNI